MQLTISFRKKENTMKKAVSLFLVLVLCLTLCACGNDVSQNTEVGSLAPSTAGGTGGSVPTDTTADCHHHYAETARVDATADKEGSITYTCSSCGKILIKPLYITDASGLEYSVNSDGTYTVAGYGNRKDTHITIPSYVNGYKVTAIGKGAFYDYKTLISVTIPDTVTRIEAYAFDGCSSLTDIAIPGSVTTIGDSAFSNCSSLTSITISEGVTSIGYTCFSYCINLTEVALPNSLANISIYAFTSCYSLKNITIPEGITTINSYTFSGCKNLTSVTISSSVTDIDHDAFLNCSSLQEIHFTGTKDQWNKIKKDSRWNYGADNCTVYCVDGSIN